MGDYQEALYTQHKAVMMSERVLGIDHPQTATEYVSASDGKRIDIERKRFSSFLSTQIHMALYSFANSHAINAAKLLCRARYIILTCCGENHPQISLIDVSSMLPFCLHYSSIVFQSNLGLILQSSGDYENALKFMEKSLELNKK